MSNTWHLPDSHGRFMPMVTPSAPPENGRGGRPQKIKRVGMMLCRRRGHTPSYQRSIEVQGWWSLVTCLPLLPEESGSGGHHSLASLVVVMVVVVDEVGVT